MGLSGACPLPDDGGAAAVSWAMDDTGTTGRVSCDPPPHAADIATATQVTMATLNR